jgi:hypothetical protein
MHSAADLKIELGDTAKFSCPCCGRASETVHGFLYDPTGETSVYFAGYTPGHPRRRANMVLSVGGWGDGKNAEDRTAIALEASFGTGQDDVEFKFPPAETSPWYGKRFLGRMLEPDELSEENREQYRQLALAAVEKDPRVSGYRQSG